jgi:DNA-binding Lrp family transcriptional regulator
MVIAYVLIIAQPGTEKMIVQELVGQDNVEDVDIVFGDYDILFRVRLDSVNQLNGFILEKIRPIPGIKRTSTLLMAE